MKLVKELAQNHPRTEVAYAPTTSFARAFPDEVDMQTRAFTQPTWASRLEGVAENPVAPVLEVPKVQRDADDVVPGKPLDHDVLIAGILCSAAIFLCGLLTGWLLSAK